MITVFHARLLFSQIWTISQCLRNCSCLFLNISVYGLSKDRVKNSFESAQGGLELIQAMKPIFLVFFSSLYFFLREWKLLIVDFLDWVLYYFLKRMSVSCFDRRWRHTGLPAPFSFLLHNHPSAVHGKSSPSPEQWPNNFQRCAAASGQSHQVQNKVGRHGLTATNIQFYESVCLFRSSKIEMSI